MYIIKVGFIFYLQSRLLRHGDEIYLVYKKNNEELSKLPLFLDYYFQVSDENL